MCVLGFEGGDRLKFGDLIICVASIAVIAAFIHAPIDTTSSNAFFLSTSSFKNIV
jgi:hypothetical protein